MDNKGEKGRETMESVSIPIMAATRFNQEHLSSEVIKPNIKFFLQNNFKCSSEIPVKWH